jgi:hypothetical protein
MGCEVLTSETPDFLRQADQGAFESCFEALKQCQYYVLLVGGRRGSWFDKAAGISVTQQEFRIALPLAAAGQLHIIVIIREEVQTALRERRRILEAAGPARLPVEPPSAILDDPAFIQQFVNEIDSTALREDTGPLWRYSFSTFEQIVDALRVNLHLRRPLRRQALLANLRWELLHNLSELIENYRGLPQPIHDSIGAVRAKIRLTADHLGKTVTLDRDQAVRVGMYWIGATTAANRLISTALEDAIRSGEFLNYDHAARGLRPTPEYEAMQKLRSSIDQYRVRSQSFGDHAAAMDVFAQSVRRRLSIVKIEANDLGYLYGLHDVSDDITRLSLSLLRFAIDQAQPFSPPHLSPISPYDDQIKLLESHRSTYEMIEGWASDGILWGILTGDNSGEVESNLAVTFEKFPELKRIVEEAAAEDARQMDRVLEEGGPTAAREWFRQRFGSDPGELRTARQSSDAPNPE